MIWMVGMAAACQTVPELREKIAQRYANGIPISGRSRDAFRSGHALHMGALASAAGLLAPLPRRVIRSLALALSDARRGARPLGQ
jgi:hypothetical protein